MASGNITLKKTKLGIVHCDLYCCPESAVNSFIESAYSETLDRNLTDTELKEFNEHYVGEVAEYSYGDGGSVNHN